MFSAIFRRFSAPFAALLVMAGLAAPAGASGDLLVAPTRIVLDGPRGAEVVLNNIGSAPATYRISLELRRMRDDGSLEDISVDNATPQERATLDMLFYSPRRVTLPPNQPQTIRLGVRAPEGLADGEYRAHLLFRAVPEARPVVASEGEPPRGVSISLTPIYGVTIPVIIRQGTLQATAGLAHPRIVAGDPNPTLELEISRQGNRSVYGEIQVVRQGSGEVLMQARGVAVYTEREARTLALPLSPEQAAAMRGPVTVRYIEDRDVGGATLAEVQAVL
jgi:P pilus assembly chaperone PapD